MLGWEGTINELYKTGAGKLLGYEVQETQTIATYNTLWFNLNDTTGINSVKGLEAPLSENNLHLMYINGSEDVFATKLVGGFGAKMLSRRYDIEFRTQYFSYLDGEDLKVVAVEIPMLFVQEEQLGSLSADIVSANKDDISSFELDLTSSCGDRIMNDYDELVDEFLDQKNEYSVQMILDFVN